MSTRTAAGPGGTGHDAEDRDTDRPAPGGVTRAAPGTAAQATPGGTAPEATGGQAARHAQQRSTGFLPWLQRNRRVLLAVTALLTIGSYFLPLWGITLHAPQYPGGLTVNIVGTGLTGNVSEVDELNHYIGMMKLEGLAGPERKLWPFGVVLLVLILLAAALLRGRLAALLPLAVVAYPVVFAADLYRWLDYSGHHLDPHAALSTSVSPFMPAFWGTKMVGQFQTTAAFGSGFWLMLVAAVLGVLAAVAAWRRAPQP